MKNAGIRALPSRFFLAVIKVYQLTLSPWLGQSCRFHPTCSNYSEQAIEQHGVVKGCWLTLKRIGRCHPWHEGGYDPVPDKD